MVKRTLGCQQNVRPAAVAQTDDLLPLQGVQLLRYDGAVAVPGAQAAAVVQAQRKHLGKRTHAREGKYTLVSNVLNQKLEVESESMGFFEKLNTYHSSHSN